MQTYLPKGGSAYMQSSFLATAIISGIICRTYAELAGYADYANYAAVASSLSVKSSRFKFKVKESSSCTEIY
jgi:hypothetical protein